MAVVGDIACLTIKGKRPCFQSACSSCSSLYLKTFLHLSTLLLNVYMPYPVPLCSLEGWHVKVALNKSEASYSQTCRLLYLKSYFLTPLLFSFFYDYFINQLNFLLCCSLSCSSIGLQALCAAWLYCGLRSLTWRFWRMQEMLKARWVLVG